MGNICTDGREAATPPSVRDAPRRRPHRHDDSNDVPWDSRFPALTRTQLAKKRQEFWDTRVGGRKEVWQAIHVACESPENATIILESAGIRPFDMDKGDLVFTYDELGYRYELPMYVVHEPSNLLADDAVPAAAPVTNAPQERSDEEKKLDEMKVVMKIRLSSGEDLSVEMKGSETILDVKKRVSAVKRIGVEKQRALYQGRILRDDVIVARTGVKLGNFVQMMVTN